MYIFIIVSTIYICFIFSLMPPKNNSTKTLDELEEEYKLENEILEEFDFVEEVVELKME